MPTAVAPAAQPVWTAKSATDLPPYSGNGTITLYAGLSVSAGRRDWRLGGRFDVSPSLGIRAEGVRQEQQNEVPDDAIRLSLHTAW